MRIFRNAIRHGSVALVLAGLLGAVGIASAVADNKKAPPAKAAPAAKPAATGGATHGTTAGGSLAHGSTTTSHGPTANSSHTTTGSHLTTTGSHTTTTGGGFNRGGAGANTHGGVGAAGGHSAFRGPAPRGVNEHVARNGSAVRMRPNGRVSDIHDSRRGMDVHHGLAGGRRVSMERGDHSRVYAERGRRGFVQRPYGYHGHDFARRSYYYHGRAYDRYYRGYGYHGVYLNVYAPGYYYAPAFYGWAYNPWAVPIAYGWGWGVGNPWFGFYGGYFTPYAVYPSAAFWLTDYIISQDLQAAYAARQEQAAEAAAAAGAPPAGGAPALTPEVKQMIADEVRAQLALENQEAGQNAQQQDVDPASSGIARMLSDGRPHVFVAGGSVDVVDASSGQECAISDGDALQLQAPPAPDATAANLLVLASKGGVECPRSSTITVQLTDLQEMQNHMRETIDQGLQDLQAKQGKGGLPPAPPSAQAQPAAAAYAAAAPPPEANVNTEIAQADQQSDQAEKDATADAAQPDSGAPSPVAAAAAAAPPPPAAPTATVELGQTPDQVKAALGAPTRIANLGPKVIYYYNGMKITFKAGKVSDVE